ncbi:IS5 family transposase [Skermanella sp. TT6]|uniref:IS5 family transposase n=1 Tax=Skermanella cutis TaxID=2775420 RepID=A0ABX7BA13_9PROT|nr:IS5 family transposase [Skermanella sp. TT6]QQP91224.1 IS5 family transposase [Skermanella sp. TT6]
MDRIVLRDDQWERIAPLVPGKVGDPGRSGANNRRFVEAVLWIARVRAPWRDLPEGYGNWNSVFQRFRRWAKGGVFEKIFGALSADADFEYVIVDGSIVRVHQHGTGAKWGPRKQAIGRSRGGLTTKIVALVDALGNLVRFVLLPGQRHDSVGVAPLLKDLDVAALRADKAFDGDALRADLNDRGAVAVIPPKSNRATDIPCDFEMYKWRHLVENFFCKIKGFRRIATRYDKTDTSFAAMIHLVGSVLATR